ncbi:MAG: GtrA family protein [Methylobacterium sp.]|jgi:putative flippase GtrA|nr:GtrA family protein [Methylobacterium sp.]MCA3638696.1 GtrA family protein [Methylobacterium sp.]
MSGAGWLRQVVAFFGVGVIAAIAHYGTLIGLVETGAMAVIPATLVGYGLGGIVSYALNRLMTFEATRSHRQAGWRFAVVAGVGFGLTWLLMSLIHGRWGLPYLAAQVLTTGVVLVWSFLAHKYWSFGEGR